MACGAAAQTVGPPPLLPHFHREVVVLRIRCIAAALSATMIAACGSLGSGDAERLLKEQIGSGEPVNLSIYVGRYSGGEQVAELVRLGLIQQPATDARTGTQEPTVLTPAGVSLGLTFSDREWVTGKLCDITFGMIKEFRKAKGDSVPVVKATYVLRHSGPTPLLEKVHGSKAIAADACDISKEFPKQAQFVRIAGAWRINNAPKVPGNVITKVNYQYGQFSAPTGAINEMTINKPVDPDGDSVTVTWEGLEFNGKALEPMTTLKPAGLTATFPGMSGAVVYAIARDPFGGVDSVRFCFASRGFSCSR